MPKREQTKTTIHTRELVAWQPTIRRLDTQVAITSSRCCPIPRSELMVTSSTRMVLTREAPGMMSGREVIDFRPFLTTISSLVLLRFRRMLFSMAEADMCSNSSVAVERWLEPTRRYVSSANLTITLHSCFGWRSEATTMYESNT